MFRIKIKVHYPRWFQPKILLLSAVGLAVALVTSNYCMDNVGASDPVSVSSAIQGLRNYYLTETLHTGHNVIDACVPGYHFASIWEIADPSSLKYNTSLGLTSPDSGSGPPVAIDLFGVYHVVGWVRTGYTNSSTETPGRANCLGWATQDSSASGTIANLPSNWNSGEQDIGLWNIGLSTCDYSLSVWCVQDDSLWNNFLPLILR